MKWFSRSASKGRLLGNLRHASHPALIALVGALFALSFDTLSQAAFFALTATQFGGWQHALVLALLFTFGMLLTDGINGLWIARLIARADQVALVASRVMGLVVSGCQFAGCRLRRGEIAFAGCRCLERGQGTGLWLHAGGDHRPQFCCRRSLDAPAVIGLI